MASVLKANNIVKYFYQPEKFQVLKGVDFDVAEGEFLSIVGKSGCGKSTLLYILSTMDTDYEGSLEIKGETLTGKSQNDLARFRNENLGFVFQFHYLLPEFTALMNVMLPALRLGRYSKEEVEERAIQKLRLVGMDEYAMKHASKLSGGQQQRVAIARATILRPAVLLADEPTGNLDRATGEEVVRLLEKLNNDGMTLIMVTHDQPLGARAHRQIKMEDGGIVSDITSKPVKPMSEAAS